MKKFYAITLALALAAALGLAACTGNTNVTTPENNGSENLGGLAQVPNPWVEYTTLDEAIEAAGFDITVPDTVDGYPEKLIQVMDGELIEVRFIGGDEQVSIRKAAGSDDISGVYNEYETVATETVNGNDVSVSSNGDTAYLANWTANGNTYSVFASAGMSVDALLAIVEAVA